MLKNDSVTDKIARIINSAGKRPTKPHKIATKKGEFISCVDSGSVATVANAKKTFPNEKVEPSKASTNGVAYVAADGGLMPNRGEVTVNVVAGDVDLGPMKWQDADVNMPILSVRRIAKKGSRVSFWDGGGVIKLPDGTKVPFYEYQGVYLIKLAVKPPDGSGLPSFTGQGN